MTTLAKLNKKVMRKYSKNFKLKIVGLMLAKENIMHLAKHYKLNPSLMYTWKKRFGKIAPRAAEILPQINTLNAQKEIKRHLRDEIFKMEKELETLRAALVIFSKGGDR